MHRLGKMLPTSMYSLDQIIHTSPLSEFTIPIIPICFTLALSFFPSVCCQSRFRGQACQLLKQAVAQIVEEKGINRQFFAFQQFANCSQCFLSPKYASINVMNYVFVLLMSCFGKEKSKRNKDFSHSKTF